MYLSFVYDVDIAWLDMSLHMVVDTSSRIFIIYLNDI